MREGGLICGIDKTQTLSCAGMSTPKSYPKDRFAKIAAGDEELCVLSPCDSSNARERKSSYLGAKPSNRTRAARLLKTLSSSSASH